MDGTRYYADKVVLAAGAWSPVLVDLEEQCVSKVSETVFFFASTLNTTHYQNFVGMLLSKDKQQNGPVQVPLSRRMK